MVSSGVNLATLGRITVAEMRIGYTQQMVANRINCALMKILSHNLWFLIGFIRRWAERDQREGQEGLKYTFPHIVRNSTWNSRMRPFCSTGALRKDLRSLGRVRICTSRARARLT